MEKVKGHHSKAKTPRIEKESGFKRFGKKAQVAGLLLANPLVLTILAVAALLILLTFVGVGIFLALNIFTVLGVIITLVALLMAYNGIGGSVNWGLISLGVLLLLLPIASDSFNGITLAAVMP